MNKEKHKTDLFYKNLVTNKSNSITGVVKSVDYNKKEGRFWVKTPNKLKNDLFKGYKGRRHGPCVFYFKDIENKTYIPQKGDPISCSYSIYDNKIGFYNIRLLKTTPIGNNSNLKRTQKIKRTIKYNRRTIYPRKTKNKNKKRNPNKNQSNVHAPPTPRVFMILGHSYECAYKYANPNKKIIDILEKAYTRFTNYIVDIDVPTSAISDTPQYKYFNRMETEIKTLKGDGMWVSCHRHPDRIATVFCKDCFDSDSRVGYLLCPECHISGHNQTDSVTNTNNNIEGETILIKNNHKNIIKLNYDNIEDEDELELYNDPGRIDLTNDFKDILPNNRIRYLNGQSSGRYGLIRTSFNIMESMQYDKDFRDLIYDSSDMDDMHYIDKYLNNVNLKWKYHSDGMDTNFGIYPRINYNNVPIYGPYNTNTSFSPIRGNEILYNGHSWPLGIYELPIFNIHESERSQRNYNILFKNGYSSNDSSKVSIIPEWDFYSTIRDKSSVNIIKRALLLKMPPHNRTDEEKELKSLEKEIKTITKYNRYLISKIDDPDLYDPDKTFKLDTLIRNIVRIADIKPGEEIIFITNVCRGLKTPSSEINMTKSFPFNQTANNTIGKYARARRNESRGTSPFP